MKKLILALATVAFIGIGGSAVSAQSDPTPLPNTSVPLPIECSESNAPGGTRTVDIDGDNKPDIPASCVDFYVAEQQVVVQLPPPAVTTTVPATVPPGQLPRTGSGVSPILGIGALLLVGGGIVVVATRRRSTSSSPST